MAWSKPMEALIAVINSEGDIEKRPPHMAFAAPVWALAPSDDMTALTVFGDFDFEGMADLTAVSSCRVM
jgi:hypothetical protein